MSAEAPPERPAARAGWLLRLGARAAFSTVGELLVLAGVLAIAATVRAVLWPAVLGADPSLRLDRTLLVAGIGLLLVALLGRTVVIAVAVHSGAARIATAGPERPISPAVAALRGIAWAAAATILDLLLDVWFWTSLVSSVLALALGGPLVSLVGALGGALVLTVTIFLVPAGFLWLELGLVTSIVRPVTFGAAAVEAARILLARPGFLILALVATHLPAGFLVGAVQALASGAPGPGRPAAGAAGVALLLAALAKAVGTLVRLDAFAALVLDREGRLPAPPPPVAPLVPVPRATLVGPEVVEARPVGPLGPWPPEGAR